MTTIAQRAAAPTLSNPAASSSGHVHRVYFIDNGDTVSVVTDDCVMETTRTMTREKARAQWRRYQALGFKR